nr:putative endochitinase [Quercus suber]
MVRACVPKHLLIPTPSNSTYLTQKQPSSQFSHKPCSKKNPSLKTLLSIAGGIADDSALSSMASNASTRKTFIDSSITIGRPYNFHGLDLDWEFSSTTTDMTNLGLLFKKWREAVEKESKNSNKPQLLLTAVVYYSSVFRS